MFHLIFIGALTIGTPQIEARIVELQPNVDRTYAHELASEVAFWSLWYQCDPMITVAIAMQESSLRPDAVSATGDITVFQFSPQTVKAYRLDRVRLKSDLRYQVTSHFIILRDKKNTCRDRQGWSCYHSTTPRLRKEYEHLVLRYYKSPKQVNPTRKNNKTAIRAH